MKELKNYIHLYIGCDVKKQYEEGMEVSGKLVGVTASEVELWETLAIVSLYDDIPFQEFYVEEVKLVLRPLSDMTEEEKKKAHDIYYNDKIELLAIMDVAHFELCRYLLSCGFDLFGLIDVGLAVSKTETKN